VPDAPLRETVPFAGRLLAAQVLRSRRYWAMSALGLVMILAVNTVFLLPRIDQQEARVLERLRVEANTIVRALDHMASARYAPADFAAIAEQIMPGTRLQGGAVYDAKGEEIQVFGERPALRPPVATDAAGQADALSGDRYDIAWRAVDQGEVYYLVARTNASTLAAEKRATFRAIIRESIAISLVQTLLLLLLLARALRIR